MKKLILNISLIGSVMFSLGALQSCNDALDTNPQPGTVQDDGTPFADTDALYGYLMGNVYGSLEPSTAIYTTAVLSDEVKPGSGSGGQEFDVHRFFFNSQTAQAAAVWQNNYAVINHVNRLVRGAEAITPTSTADAARLSNILAQARAIRAFAYIQLESLYSENMTDPNALGVILLKDVPDLTSQLPRVKNSDIYSFIEADINYAKSVLTTEASTQYFIGKSAINAIAARYFLYKGDYAQAKTNAELVISASSAGGFPLTPATPITNAASGSTVDNSTWRAQFYAVGTSFNPYRSMWVDERRGETIFSLGRIATAGNGVAVGTYWNTNASNISGSPMWFWGRNLYNLLLAGYNGGTGGDVRFLVDRDPTTAANANYATLYPNNLPQTRTTDRLVIDKYPGKTGTNTRNDLKLFRLSEMYFILAECAINSNQLATAAGYIKNVRDARNYLGPVALPVYANAQAAWADVLQERRIELAIEGHRYIDLKRLAVKAGVTMDRNNTDDIVPTTNLANGDYRYTFPIPLSEIAANPTIQQNTGY
ncbi:Starch-binding associating with outer membrane [Chryseobacterium soldanellicola]|uniref:Starch-binding associating with outer membrane n=1 Tax=Chryseobacterium soldanellicola TaxID=311333 RepID=A0A1H1A5T9_9FLAO|nr:RagB/SusD family nutrient uptake outer membrane protein [Chryseobacterium soldanellicola]SDQ35033.1 Starch-binding associating with outer membrane [Chryseobacterium soldanellicola]